MDDVWFGPGLTRDDYDAFLEGLSLHDSSAPPLLAIATSQAEGARLVLASCAFLDIFGVGSYANLARRLLQGTDPGAERLGILSRTLPLDGAPRLERLRFFMGPTSEILMFLCRRIARADGAPVLLAAALGVRAGQARPPGPPRRESAAVASLQAPQAEELTAPLAPRPAQSVISNGPMSVQAIQGALRTRWPASRTVRFLWQTDANAVCTRVTAPLESVVGGPNADLVGRNLLELAPKIDPSGRLAEALGSRSTWSGLDVDWPIAEAHGAVAVGLGAIPEFDRERVFDGYRGYGVIHLDKVVAHAPTHLVPRGESAPSTGNVVPFPGGQRGFSLEDQIAFDTLGAELRDRTGLAHAQPAVAASHGPPAAIGRPEAMSSDGAREPAAQPPPGPATFDPAPSDDLASHAPVRLPESSPPEGAPLAPRRPTHNADLGKNAPAVLDRLAIGLLVSRDNVPIFANRHLLDMLGFDDEDALHAAGGLAHLFGDQPGNVTGSEAIGVRARDGTIVPTNARMQRIDWDDLPATLLTLQYNPDSIHNDEAAAGADAVRRAADEREAAVEAMSRRHEEEHRRTDGEIRELRAILETATDGVAVIDARCDVVSLNRSGEALFGCDRGAVIGKPFLGLFAQDNQDLAKDYLDGLKSNATKSLLNDGREFLVKARQGGTIPVFMTLGRLDASGDLSEGQSAGGARFCALFRDLTHWKKAEGDLETAKLDAERASALKSDFLAKVSHEVRTPLNAIIGFAEVMLEERFGPVGNERYKEYLRDIHGSGTHVMSLVNDLLDLSKIEAGKMDLSIIPLDANKVISECVGLMQPQASRERVIMRLSLAPSLPLIKADERSLRQIILNLLSNAVKFNEPGGQVIVATAAPEDGKVVIRIRDTGPGMSEDDIAAALEPFRQLSPSSPGGGTGLGLPLTKALVEANDAALTIRSKVDQGTLVEVAFPLARVSAT